VNSSRHRVFEQKRNAMSVMRPTSMDTRGRRKLRPGEHNDERFNSRRCLCLCNWIRRIECPCNTTQLRQVAGLLMPLGRRTLIRFNINLRSLKCWP